MMAMTTSSSISVKPRRLMGEPPWIEEDKGRSAVALILPGGGTVVTSVSIKFIRL